MKANIHPEYHHIKAVCACGNEIELGSVNKTACLILFLLTMI